MLARALRIVIKYLMPSRVVKSSCDLFPPCFSPHIVLMFFLIPDKRSQRIIQDYSVTTGLLQINKYSKMLLLLSINTKIISTLRKIRFLPCRIISLVLLTRFPYLARRLSFCLQSVANCDVHRASNAETTNTIHSHSDGQTQSMKCKGQRQPYQWPGSYYTYVPGHRY